MRIALLLGLALLALPVHAQEPAGDETAPANEPENGTEPAAEPATVPVAAEAEESGPAETATQLEDIVVTSTKRAKSVRDIPASITALDGEALEKIGAQGIDDFIQLLPGVAMQDDGVLKRVTIRGIAASQSTSNTTGTLIGEVPFNNPYVPRVTLDPNPFDLATVEALKGPQGTLFGGSALNGAIRYVPQAPVLGEWTTKAFGQRETVAQGGDGLIYGGALNVPVGETFALRLVGHERKSAGWIDLDQLGRPDANVVEQTGARALASWQPTTRWKVNALAMTQDTFHDELTYSGKYDDELRRKVAPVESYLQTDYTFGTLGVEYAFDRFAVLAQSTRMKQNLDTFLDASYTFEESLASNPPSSSPVSGDVVSRTPGWIHELRFTSDPAAFDGKWQWLGGLFAYDVNVYEVFDYVLGAGGPSLPGGSPFPGFEGYLTQDGFANGGHFVTDIDFLESAAFGETTYTFADAIELTLGGRYYRMVLDGTITGTGALGLTSGGGSGRSEGQRTETGFNPKLALQYHLDPAIAVYGSASKGFRFGGIQLIADPGNGEIPSSYGSDSLWNYEVGVRSQWLRNTLVADVTAYYVDWTDAQLAVTHSSGTIIYVLNVGGVRSQGVEAGVRYLTPISGLSLDFTGALMDTRTTEDFTDPSGRFSPAGTRWPVSPSKQFRTTLTHQLFLGAWQVGNSLTHSYLGSGWNELQQQIPIFDFHTWAYNLSFGNPGFPGAPELTLSGTNLTDERGVMGAIPLTPVRAYVRPRTVTLRLGISF